MAKTLIVSTIILFLLSPTLCFSQAYNQRKVYVYDYKLTSNKNKKEGKLYLGCSGKILNLKDENQYKITWATSAEELKNGYGNTTGVIDDSLRFFLHPPRYNEFSILEYSPFPQANYPLKVGEKWTWKLPLGKYWENPSLYIKAEDILRYEFSITGKETIFPAYAKPGLVCYQIEAESKTEKKSSFIGLFNPKYGFTSMIFENIDNSKIEIKLTNIIRWEDLGGQYNSVWRL